METENPYQSPGGSGKGEYDWTTAKRMFVAFAVLSIFYLTISLVTSIRQFQQIDRNAGDWQTIKAFFSDWRERARQDATHSDRNP